MRCLPEEMKDVVFHGKKDEYWTSASPHLSLLDCVSHATILNARGSTSHGVNWAVYFPRAGNFSWKMLSWNNSHPFPFFEGVLFYTYLSWKKPGKAKWWCIWLSRAKCINGSGMQGTRRLQKCWKVRGLGCVNQACTRARVTQPSPYIFLPICILGLWYGFNI